VTSTAIMEGARYARDLASRDVRTRDRACESRRAERKDAPPCWPIYDRRSAIVDHARLVEAASICFRSLKIAPRDLLQRSLRCSRYFPGSTSPILILLRDYCAAESRELLPPRSSFQVGIVRSETPKLAMICLRSERT